MVPGFGVLAECQSIGSSGKKQRAVARSRGLVIQPQKLSVCAYFQLSFLGCAFLIHLSNKSDSPRFLPNSRRQNLIFFTNSNILHTLKKEPLNIMLLHTSRTVWCLGRVPKHWNQWQEVEGLLFSPQNSQLVYILSFHSQGVFSLFIFPTGTIALYSEPRGRRYLKNTGHNRNCLYSRAIH